MSRKEPEQRTDTNPIEIKDLARLNILAFSVFLLFSSLILAFYKVQILEFAKWSKIAKTQHKMAVEEPCKRGIFFGRSLCPSNPKAAIPLVIDLYRYHLHVDPYLIPQEHRLKFTREISKRFGLDANEVKLELLKKSRSRRLLSFLTRSEKEAIESWYKEFVALTRVSKKGIFFTQDYKRHYPYGESLGQVLHTYRYDSKRGLGYPTGGLELFFDPVLKGEKGKKILLRSPRQKIDQDELVEPAKDGFDIQLTIDPVVQAIAEVELEKGVLTAGAKGGSVVIMDPHSGEIMAIASYPFFHPGRVEEYYNDFKKMDATRLRAVNDSFEPGSIMKPISALVALLANQELIDKNRSPLFSPIEMMDVTDTSFPGRLKPIKDVRSHRFLNMRLALQKSSNVYVARLIERVIKNLGEKWYRKQLSDLFLFGKKSGIELPSEHLGMLPEIGKKYQSGLLEWSVPTPFSLAMGYNLQCNQVQILRAFASIINGGYLVKPTLIQKIANPTKTIFEQETRKSHKLPLNTFDLDEIKKALVFTTQKGGTAVYGNIRGYTEGGKSGTTEKLVNGSYCATKHYASFIGFAPFQNTKFVMIVGIDEPQYQIIPGLGYNHYGGKCSARVFSRIGEKLLPYLGVVPDDPTDQLLKDEVVRLTELYDAWNSR
ncbi:MAG: peptidoglycan D,D-transpeptidase FtsI family protein [Chlamydiia bacterium]|jgi:cell division protein FtsI (penicillin-binding protein 3)